MNRFLRALTLGLFAGLLITVCVAQEKKDVRDDFKKYFDAFKVDGSFALYDLKGDSYVFYNESQFKQPFTPASTFKICN